MVCQIIFDHITSAIRLSWSWLAGHLIRLIEMVLGHLICLSGAGFVMALKQPEDLVNICLNLPYIQNRLKHIRNAGWTAFHVLAEHHGQHMCTLLKAVEESEAIEILSITNDTVHDHKSVAAFLSQQHPAQLVDLCLARPRIRTALMDITQGGTCVYGSLSVNHGAQMKRLLEGIEPEEAKEMLQIRVQDGFVGYNLAHKFPEEFTHLGVELLVSLKGARSNGWTAFHTLADQHGQHMCTLLDVIDPIEAIDILGLVIDKTQDYRSVASVLWHKSCRDFMSFQVKSLLSGFQRSSVNTFCNFKLLEFEKDFFFIAFNPIDIHTELQPGHTYFWSGICEHPSLSLLRGMMQVDGLEMQGVLHVLPNREVLEMVNIVDHGHQDHRITVAIHMTDNVRDIDPSSSWYTLLITNSEEIATGVTAGGFRGVCNWSNNRLGNADEDEVTRGNQVRAVARKDDQDIESVDVKKLMSFIRFPTLSTEIEDRHLNDLLESVGVDIEAYLTELNAYSTANRQEIKKLLHVIVSRIPSEDDSNHQEVISSLKSVVNDVRCFAHHYHRLLSFLIVESSDTGILETNMSLDIQHKLMMETFQVLKVYIPSRVQTLLSQKLFAGSGDSMSAHASACICHALDVVFGLYQGEYPDDESFCPSSPVTLRVVQEITRSLTTVEALHDDLCEIMVSGEHKYQVLQQLIGPDKTEQFAVQIENVSSPDVSVAVDCFGSQMAIYDATSKRLILTTEGLRKLFRDANLLICRPTLVDTSTKLTIDCQSEIGPPNPLTDTLVPAVTATILNVLFHARTLSFHDWFLFRILPVIDRKYRQFLRMHTSICAVLTCHIDNDIELLRAYNLLSNNDLGACLFQLLAIEKYDLLGLIIEDSHFANHAKLHDVPVALQWASEQSAKMIQLLHVLKPSARKQILLTKNPDTNKLSVPALLSKRNPAELVFLCVDYKDIRNELKQIRHAGWTTFHVLAEYHGQHMCTLLKSVEESEAIEILSITNDTVHDHKSVAAFLSQKHPSELVDLCLARPRIRTALMDITQGGTCVYGSLSVNHGAQMKRLLEGIEPEEAKEMLQIRVQHSFVGYNLAWKFPEEFTHLGVELLVSLKGARSNGWAVFHSLADHHGQHMCTLLMALEESEAIEILSITNDTVHDHKSVVSFLVQKHPTELVDLCLARPRIRTALMDITQGGMCVYGSLSVNHGAQMKRLLEGIEPEEAKEMLQIRVQHSFVGYNLAWKFPEEFTHLGVELLVSLKGARSNGWAVFHSLADHHGQHMCTLLKAVEESEAIEILSITNDTVHDHKSVASFLSQKHPTELVDLCLARPRIRTALMDITQGGMCVYGSLSVNHGAQMKRLLEGIEPEEAKEMLQIRVHHSFVGYNLAHKFPEEFTHLGVELLVSLKGARSNGWAVFHSLADHHGQHMCTLLKALEESEVIEILSITNDTVHDHKSVASFLSQNHPAELVDLCLARPRIRTALMDIKQGGMCVYGSLSVNHGAQMKRLLEGIEPEEAKEMLQIRVQHTFVGYNLAWKFPEEFTHLGVELLVSLKGARSNGWAVFHSLAEYHGHHMCTLLKALEESEAIEILSITNDTVHDHKSVASFLVQKHPSEFVDLCLECPRIRATLMSTRSKGSSVYYCLAEHHGQHMLKLLQLIVPSEAVDILNVMKNTTDDYQSVLSVLYQKRPAQTTCLLLFRRIGWLGNGMFVLLMLFLVFILLGGWHSIVWARSLSISLVLSSALSTTTSVQIISASSYQDMLRADTQLRLLLMCDNRWSQLTKQSLVTTSICSNSVVKTFDTFCAKFSYLSCYAMDCHQLPSECEKISRKMTSTRTRLEKEGSRKVLILAIQPRHKTVPANQMSQAFKIRWQGDTDDAALDHEFDNSWKELKKWVLGYFEKVHLVQRFENVDEFLSTGSFAQSTSQDSFLYKAICITSEATIPAAWMALSLLHQDTMQFASVHVKSCTIPETCHDLVIAGIKVRRNPTIVCIRLKQNDPTIRGDTTQFDAKLIDGDSLKEKMDLLAKFARQNAYTRQYQQLFDEL